MVSLRFADEWVLSDWDSFYRSMMWASVEAQRAEQKTWVKHINVHHAFGFVREGHAAVVAAEGFFVVHNVDSPWWNLERKILDEMMVVRNVTAPGNVRMLPKVLDALAQHYRVDAACVGDALARDDRLARFYQRYGWKPESKQLIKEYTWAE